jgi:hypothetical protein
MIYMKVAGERWPRSAVIGAATQTHDRSGSEEKSHSRVGGWRTRTGVCCVGESGVERGMGEYMRLSGG